MTERSENYLQGKLGEEEQKLLRESLSKEEKEELAFEAGVSDAIQEDLRERLKSQVQGFESRAETKQRNARPVWIGGIAASLILLVGAIYIFNTQNSSTLYDDYYEPYPNYELTVTRGEEDLSVLQEAYLAYDLEDYKRAERLFSNALTMEENLPASFFQGMSRMELQKFGLAVDSFSPVLATEGDYKEAAMWYAALANLKLERSDLAISILDQLEDSNEYRTQVKRLIKELK